MSSDLQGQLSGGIPALPVCHYLNAGPVSVLYEKGALRYIKTGEIEVVRMIYPAVRDENWDTVNPMITNEHIEDNNGTFIIALRCEYRSGLIHYAADYKITGKEDGTITFEMSGTALTNFKKNRIGFCVLHPIQECAGKPCEITTPAGNVSSCCFPEQISPKQPFKNISSMSWALKQDLKAHLSFQGDIFETEDQRNWTDASFKTYCTPLDDPFPVEVAEGQTFQQTVELRFEGAFETGETGDGDQRLTVHIDQEALIPLPELGVCRSSEISELSESVIAGLRELNLGHYRIDIRMDEENWPLVLQKSAEEAKAIKAPLFIALHLVDGQAGIDAFIRQARTIDVKIAHFLVLKRSAKATPSDMIHMAVPVLRANFPDAMIGAGTDAYFAELNRNPVDAGLLDFVNFSINPQVHAFDDRSLVETLEAQKDVVKSAKMQYPETPVYISPITFKPRFNPDATTPQDSILSGNADMRQSTLFGAGWMLGSIKNLAEAGSRCITYFESVGRKGFGTLEDRDDPARASLNPGDDYPVKFVLKKLLSSGGIDGIKLSKDSHPLLFSSLVLAAGPEDTVLLSNHTEGELPVHLGNLGGNVFLKQLDVSVICRKNWLEEFSRMESERIESQEVTVVLNPRALAVLTIRR